MGNPISLKLEGIVCARCHREIASIPMNGFVVRRQKHGYEMVPVTAIGCVRATSKGLEYELDDGGSWFEYGSLVTFMAANGSAFVQISRSTAVRLNAIVAVQRPPDTEYWAYQIKLINGQVHDVSRRRWPSVQRRLGTELIRCGKNKARDLSRALPLAAHPDKYYARAAAVVKSSG